MISEKYRRKIKRSVVQHNPDVAPSAKRENEKAVKTDSNGCALFFEGIEEIENFAFFGENDLKKAIIPETVKRIGMYAFYNCKNLEEIRLPSGLEYIGRSAFENCQKLESFVMPDSVTDIELTAFDNVDFNEPVYNADKSILYAYSCTRCGDRIVLPDTVKRIFSGAFTRRMFDSIILHDGIERIDSGAFFNCFLVKKICIYCSTDKIKNGAFRNFRKLPELWFADGSVEFTEILRICGDMPIERAEKLNIPALGFLKRNKLESLVSGFSKDNPDKMIKVAEFFLKSGKGDFFEAAAIFWYYRAAVYGSEEAMTIINKKCNEERRRLPSVALPEIGNEAGERLYALGFSFFNKKRDYLVSRPDNNGIVEVIAYAGEDGPDEDGFGREEYYDWWYLDENLQKIHGVEGFMGYSKHDKRVNEEKFNSAYQKAAEAVKSNK